MKTRQSKFTEKDTLTALTYPDEAMSQESQQYSQREREVDNRGRNSCVHPL